jgi:hypothetical protein
MSRTVLRHEGDTVHLEHKHYGRFKFSTRSSLSKDADCSAEVFAGERTDGYANEGAGLCAPLGPAERLAPTATGSCRDAWR